MSMPAGCTRYPLEAGMPKVTLLVLSLFLSKVQVRPATTVAAGRSAIQADCPASACSRSSQLHSKFR
jgi:hypothetical protein